MSQPPYLDRPPRLQKGFGEFISLLSTAAILWSSDDASSLTEGALQNSTKNVFISEQQTLSFTQHSHSFTDADVTLKIFSHSTHKNKQTKKKKKESLDELLVQLSNQKARSTTQHNITREIMLCRITYWIPKVCVCMCVCVPAQWDVSVLILLLCPCFQWQPVRILHSICHTVLTMINWCLEIRSSIHRFL